MLETFALILNLVFVAAIIWASFFHFSRSEREPLGARLLSIATVGGTIANVWLVVQGPTAETSLAAISSVLSMAALAIFFLALRASPADRLSLAFSDRTPGELVDRGIYATIRHPFYTSYIGYWLSWVFLTSFALFPSVLAAVMIAVYTVVARKEEALLRERLGEPYARLQRTTWRFLPGVH